MLVASFGARVRGQLQQGLFKLGSYGHNPFCVLIAYVIAADHGRPSKRPSVWG